MSSLKWKLRVSYTDGSSRVAFFPTKKGATAFYNLLTKQDYVTSCEIIKL